MRHPLSVRREFSMSKKEKIIKKLKREGKYDPNDPSQQFVNLDEMVAAQMELDELKQQYGLAEPKKEGKISRAISNYFRRKEDEEKVLVSRKKLIRYALLLGWCGGHRYYMKQYKMGIIYSLLFWTGWPFAMTLIDLIEIVPIPPDEDGNILV